MFPLSFYIAGSFETASVLHYMFMFIAIVLKRTSVAGIFYCMYFGFGLK